jgi:hypothetical protein
MGYANGLANTTYRVGNGQSLYDWITVDDMKRKK